jgi:hypothetical protein
MQKKLFGDEHREVSQTLRFLGGAVRRAGKLADAEAILRQGVAMQRRVSDQQRSPFLAWALDELAGLLHDQGRSAEAEGLLRESLTIKRVTLGDANPNTIGTGSFLIEVLQAQGKSNEADEVRAELANPPGSPAERNDHP